ncbi:MAG TPA: cysteine desulfurase family protein [Flavobacterium sp.]|uniref:cysteine desulfurase family protein n=1 Tax=Flavobacterium sp. TaxID=239 RepID=UPI002B4AEA64|nr:cysteine desulfurase family protein [Flavobacterium sp.]HLO72966.1 cysteine desulfurase family protein [Flavobacterium sp.]
MKKVYLDNAATTAIHPEVISVMMDVLQNDFGNPSSTHSFGRSAKTLLESARKTIAKLLNAQASEIIFTSSATEATNWVLRSAVKDLGIKRIITSKIEHHATLYTVEHLAKEFGINVEYITILPTGDIDYQDLAAKLLSDEFTLVSLMHVNNEIGTILDIKRVSDLCKYAKALFHCDTVQSVGKSILDVQDLGIDFLVASAHKFHGPKGIGFAFIKKNSMLQPLLYGGEQEKGMRAGTEAVHQVVGMAKALELANANLENDTKYISDLKNYCFSELKKVFPEVKINGENTFYNLLNVQLPLSEEKTSMLLFTLDMKGIAVSRGSACQSGSIKPSHVLAAFLSPDEARKPSLRISFSHFNSNEDIDLLVEALKTA